MIEFSLAYRGELRPNGNAAHKHQLRQKFHAQLRHLWNNPGKPAPGLHSNARPDLETDTSYRMSVGGFGFIPVISEKGFNVAEVEVIILTPEAAGFAITRSGDIDNRLKTLFDAMKVPSEQELPPQVSPSADEQPFFCVVQHDHLITRVAVESRRLLDPAADVSDVQLIMNVRGRHVSEFRLWVARQ